MKKKSLRHVLKIHLIDKTINQGTSEKAMYHVILSEAKNLLSKDYNVVRFFVAKARQPVPDAVYRLRPCRRPQNDSFQKRLK